MPNERGRGKKIPGQFVIARCNTPPILDAAEEIFNFVPTAIEARGAIGFLDRSAAIGDDRQGAVILDLLAHFNSLIAAFGATPKCRHARYPGGWGMSRHVVDIAEATRTGQRCGRCSLNSFTVDWLKKMEGTPSEGTIANVQQYRERPSICALKKPKLLTAKASPTRIKYKTRNRRSVFDIDQTALLPLFCMLQDRLIQGLCREQRAANRQCLQPLLQNCPHNRPRRNTTRRLCMAAGQSVLW